VCVRVCVRGCMRLCAFTVLMRCVDTLTPELSALCSAVCRNRLRCWTCHSTTSSTLVRASVFAVVAGFYDVVRACMRSFSTLFASIGVFSGATLFPVYGEPLGQHSFTCCSLFLFQYRVVRVICIHFWLLCAWAQCLHFPSGPQCCGTGPTGPFCFNIILFRGRWYGCW
jgi:hypothetical protein